MKIIINYFREQEGQCKWKSHNIYSIPIDYARVEFWKINLDTLKKFAYFIFKIQAEHVKKKKKKETPIFVFSLCTKACSQEPIFDRSLWNVQSTMRSKSVY